VIRALRDRADSLREAELERLLGRSGLSDADRDAVAEFSQRLLNKLLHLPTVRLREGAANGRGAALVDALRYLHGLDESARREGDESAASQEEGKGAAAGDAALDPEGEP
jgi:glutamyl-tRNA reductase